MTNELQLVVKDSGLEQNKVETLLSSFSEYFRKAKVIADNSRGIVVTSEDQTKTHHVAQETIEGLQKVMSKLSEGMRNL